MKIEFIVSTSMEYTKGAIAYSTGKDNSCLYYQKYYVFMWEDSPYVRDVYSYTIKKNL